MLSNLLLVDGHTHVQEYADSEWSGVLERAEQAGVGLIVAAGTTLESSRRAQLLARHSSIVRAGVGLHPTSLTGPLTNEIEGQLRELASDPSVVVWSETGLDFLPFSPDRTLQQQAFRTQVRIACELGLPLVTHCRGADQDVLTILREEGAQRVGGAWHYFAGGPELAQAVLALGFHISFAKTLLRSEQIQAAAVHVPLDRIVVETDAYPQPFKKHRRQWTEPWQLPQVVAKLGELKGLRPEDVAQATTANYLRMLQGPV